MQDKSGTQTQQSSQQPQESTPTTAINQQSQQVPTSSTQPAQPMAELNLEQSQSQLRQKIKENRLLQAKNKKLQARYIQLFKEQKSLKKDWSVLSTVIKDILPEIGEKGVGKYDMEELKQLWRVKETKMMDRVEEAESEMKKFKQRVQREANELAEQNIQKINRECKQRVQSLSKELESFKKNSKNLGDQLSDYDKKLELKNQEVSKLTKQKLKLEHMLNHLKMKSITDELAQNSNEQESNVNKQRNQLLALRHQVSQLMLKRDELRSELKNQRNSNEKYKLIIEQKNEEIARLRQPNQPIDNPAHLPTDPETKKIQHKQPQLQNKVSMDSSQGTDKISDKYSSAEQQGDQQFIHRQYMKNLFIRYMRSWGDTSQRQILLNIILTMLKFDQKQKQLISEKKKNWWIY